MYCKMCGNLLDDTDRSCKICGTPTGEKETPAESIEIKEEIIFNPPYRKNFVEGEQSKKTAEAEEEMSMPAETTEAEEEMPPEETDEADHVSPALQEKRDGDIKYKRTNSEFTWNVHEFPTKKKTEDIQFSWEMEELRATNQKEAASPAFEEELFHEISSESNRIQESNIDRFFTFSKKNEEFQELLDKEYEKYMKHSARAAEYFKCTEPEEEIKREDPVKPVHEAEPETECIETPSKAEHIEEMAQAREQFFAEELIKDNETIKKKLDSEEPDPGQIVEVPAEFDSKPREDVIEEEKITEESIKTGQTEETSIAAEANKEAEENAEASIASLISEGSNQLEEKTAEPLRIPLSSLAEKEHEEEEHEEEQADQKKNRVGQILLIIIAAILIIEISILGIRYFAPDSTASKSIDRVQTQMVHTVAGWLSGINDLISGKDLKEETEPVKIDTNQQEKDPVTEEPKEEGKVPAPDPTPEKDKDALVASQLGNNINIKQVKSNETLVYQAGRDYGLADINNSKPIENNIWLTRDEGDTVYFDQSVVGTIIAFDSQWIDYVNGGSDSVLELLKKDSKAYRNAVSFSKVGKVKETFQLLEIGEIRQGAHGFYVWVHEALQITEKGVTTDKQYNWIYYLEPVEENLKIVNYFKF